MSLSKVGPTVSVFDRKGSVMFDPIYYADHAHTIAHANIKITRLL